MEEAQEAFFQSSHESFSCTLEVEKKTMFGSWKPRSGDSKVVLSVTPALGAPEDDHVLSEIEEELTAFIKRQKVWPGLQTSKELPSWMKTASLTRCGRTPPLPPKLKAVPPTPPPRRRSSSRSRALGSAGSCWSTSPTPSSCSLSQGSHRPPKGLFNLTVILLVLFVPVVPRIG